MKKVTRKSLIIVNSQSNLMKAIIMKKMMFSNESWDIILGSFEGQTKMTCDIKELGQVFCHVYFGNLKSKYGKSKLRREFIEFIEFLSPSIGVANVLGIKRKDIILYKNIYFFNADRLFHNCVRYINSKRFNTKYHMYSDSLAGLIWDTAEGYHFLRFRFSWMNKIDKKRFGYDYVENLDYDFFVQHPEKVIYKTKRVLRAIPIVNRDNKEMIELLNRVFNYKGKEVCEIKEKYIFLDSARYTNQWDAFGRILIPKLREIIGADQLIVKPHPNCDLREYNNMGVKVWKDDMHVPFELYCLTHDISNKVLVNFISTAPLMPYVASDIKVRLWSFMLMYSGNAQENRDIRLIYKLYDKFSKEMDIVFIKSFEQLKQLIIADFDESCE